MTSTVLNPYPVGGALSDPSGRGFYGRDDIFAFVRSALHVTQRGPILLYGQRRIGKSSILRQLSYMLAPELTCVFYDLQGKAQLDLDQVLFGLARAIADAVQMPRPTRQEATTETFHGFLQSAIARLGGAFRLVLLFDEFDVVDQRFAGPGIAASRFIPYLAELVAREPEVGYILVVRRKTEELSEGFYSALLKDAVQKRIGRLTEEQTEHLVRDPAVGYLDITPAAMQQIHAVAAGHPYCTQLLCHTIWNQHIQADRATPVTITATHVHQALPEALERGTNGLNWIYDGLEHPVHRLFLASLAGLTNDDQLAASLEAIAQSLFDRRISMDQGELYSVPSHLESWDVIERTPAGYRFTVPMIGLWIRNQRPLDELEREVRLANPRAWKYYELALDSQRRGDFDAAIDDFRNALEANAVFVEAQLGLAAALRARGKPHDLDQAIEAYERVLDLDPNAPRTALLEALLESLEASSYAVETIRARFARITELDAHGIFCERARRFVTNAATIRLDFGTTTYLREAEQLFHLVGHAEGEARAQAIRRRVSRVSAWIGLGFLATLVLAIVAGLLFPTTWGPLLGIIFTAVSGTSLSMSTATERDGVITLRRLGLPGLLVGTAAGYLVAFVLSNSAIGGAVTAFFVSAGVNGILNEIINPLPRKPPALEKPEVEEPLRHVAITMIERVEAFLRFLRGKMKE